MKKPRAHKSELRRKRRPRSAHIEVPLTEEEIDRLTQLDLVMSARLGFDWEVT